MVTKVTYYGMFLEKKNNPKYGFIDYLGYVLYFPGLSVGPFFTF
jgi:D-alanyl-lipoteichoic acid acyltransferase DltB (MBOAT superfamily)